MAKTSVKGGKNQFKQEKKRNVKPFAPCAVIADKNEERMFILHEQAQEMASSATGS